VRERVAEVEAAREVRDRQERGEIGVPGAEVAEAALAREGAHRAALDELEPQQLADTVLAGA